MWKWKRRDSNTQEASAQPLNISEIDAELTAMKDIKNSDPIRKAQLKDWINTLKTERKKILQQEKKEQQSIAKPAWNV